jgi:hypothetical protein
LAADEPLEDEVPEDEHPVNEAAATPAARSAAPTTVNFLLISTGIPL